LILREKKNQTSGEKSHNEELVNVTCLLGGYKFPTVDSCFI